MKNSILAKLDAICGKDNPVFCICCGKLLTEVTSVNLNIGPICRKAVAKHLVIHPDVINEEDVKRYLEETAEEE